MQPARPGLQSRAGHGHRPPPPSRPAREIQPIALESLSPPSAVETMIAARGERADEIRTRLVGYLKCLLEANQLFNLTGDTSPEKQWRAHVEDALWNAMAIESEDGPPREGARIADVGSGGGMPGMIWAILWPSAHVTLVEATEKKARFLRTTGGELGLRNLTVVCDRAEAAGHMRDLRESFDWVTARALAVLSVAGEWTVPLVRIGGRIALIKSGDIEAELRGAKRAFKTLGVPGAPKIYAYTRSDGKNCSLLVFNKSERTPSPYPRRTGVATASPL